MKEISTPLLEMLGIVKRFGGQVVNDHVDFTVCPGEVHALLGENGAGKTTLMNILYGMYQADEGEIRIKGKPVQITAPRVSLTHGIGMVHQHFMLVEPYTAAENIQLMTDKPLYTRVDRAKMAAEVEELAARYGMEVDVHTPISKLSVGMQQRIEILKLLYVGAEILILDEPTAILAPQECEVLFRIIRKLVEDKKSILFISHKLDEVLQISDRITVLRHGKVATTTENLNLDKKQIVEMLIGSSAEMERVEKTAVTGNEPVMELRQVTAADERGIQMLNGVDLRVCKGEILGVAGLEGNGQDELMDVLAGLKRATGGTVTLKGKDITHRDTATFIQKGVAYVPADRNNVASVREFALFQNWELRRAKRGKHSSWLNKKKIIRETMDAIREYDIRVAGCDTRTENLSGGNLQKFILARELGKEPELFVCSNPTRGIDIKASMAIRNRILQASAGGTAIVVSSGDVEELLYLADRLVVLYRGKVVAEVNPKTITMNELGSLMLGVSAT